MRDVLGAYLINQTAGALRTRAGTPPLITNAKSLGAYGPGFSSY